MRNVLINKSIEIAERFHTGFRKDKVTPEINHQKEMEQIFLDAAKGTDLVDKAKEVIICSIYLHDVMEDYDFDIRQMVAELGSASPNSQEAVLAIVGIVQVLNKHDKILYPNGYDKKAYYAKVAENEFTTVVKSIDRIHNLSTMRSVWDLDKQERYIVEADRYILNSLYGCKSVTSFQFITNLINKFENTITECKDYIKQARHVENAFDL